MIILTLLLLFSAGLYEMMQIIDQKWGGKQ